MTWITHSAAFVGSNWSIHSTSTKNTSFDMCTIRHSLCMAITVGQVAYDGLSDYIRIVRRALKLNFPLSLSPPPPSLSRHDPPLFRFFLKPSLYCIRYQNQLRVICLVWWFRTKSNFEQFKSIGQCHWLVVLHCTSSHLITCCIPLNSHPIGHRT